MIEYLEGIDRAIVEAVNGWNTPFLDKVMWIISGKLTWIPFYLFLLFLSWRAFGWKVASVFFLTVVCTVAITDQTTTHLFKDVFQRYRPSHHALLTDRLHFYEIEPGNFYKGGTYGFISAHAANFFGICMLSIFHLKSKYKWMVPVLISIAIVVSFSRLYLGVHYLSDLFVGALLGTLVAYLMYRFVFSNIVKRWQ